MDQEPDYGEPEHEPTREEQEGDAWEYWHQRARRFETALVEIRDAKMPGEARRIAVIALAAGKGTT